jgi:hypothetical protein
MVASGPQSGYATFHGNGSDRFRTAVAQVVPVRATPYTSPILDELRFERILVTFNAQGDASPEKLRLLVKRAQQRSAVFAAEHDLAHHKSG